MSAIKKAAEEIGTYIRVTVGGQCRIQEEAEIAAIIKRVVAEEMPAKDKAPKEFENDEGVAVGWIYGYDAFRSELLE